MVIFVETIVQAIQRDPSLASKKYEHDKIELQKVLRSSFAGILYEPTEPPLLAPKVSFLSRVRLSHCMPRRSCRTFKSVGVYPVREGGQDGGTR